MPIAICQNCNRVTNSMTSDFWNRVASDNVTPKEPRIATECYAAFVDNKWVKGCAYDTVKDMPRKKMIDNLLENKPI